MTTSQTIRVRTRLALGTIRIFLSAVMKAALAPKRPLHPAPQSSIGARASDHPVKEVDEHGLSFAVDIGQVVG